MFNEKDLSMLASKGVTVVKVSQEIENFKGGFPFLPISRAASVADGIIRLSEEECSNLSKEYDLTRESKDIVKFVPASGAATRMFKALYEFVGEDKSSSGVDKILANLDSLALYSALKEFVTEESTDKEIISAIIGKDGLNYGSLPKGLLLFHKYKDSNKTPVEEHLVEGSRYATGKGGVSNIHFTISPEHAEFFKSLVQRVQGDYELELGVKYNITYSEQLPSTDTIAVDMDNVPFRNDDGSLLLRPAGHGALIENLNAIDADVVFIKTVDNVAHQDYSGDTTLYKEALAGLLVTLQDKIFKALNALDGGVIEGAEAIISEGVGFTLPTSYDALSESEKVDMLKSLLNRPIRVAGMVKNEGEPGGGPFWVSGECGSDSLQIAESSQISPDQIDLMREATHFNPVDLVCGVKGYKGEKFDLKQFVDPTTGFISVKSKDGRELKAQELPGLWNGAMAKWITLFVEVPISTFNPVKVAADLLRPQHMQK